MRRGREAEWCPLPSLFLLSLIAPAFLCCWESLTSQASDEGELPWAGFSLSLLALVQSIPWWAQLAYKGFSWAEPSWDCSVQILPGSISGSQKCVCILDPSNTESAGGSQGSHLSSLLPGVSPGRSQTAAFMSLKLQGVHVRNSVVVIKPSSAGWRWRESTRSPSLMAMWGTSAPTPLSSPSASDKSLGLSHMAWSWVMDRVTSRKGHLCLVCSLLFSIYVKIFLNCNIHSAKWVYHKCATWWISTKWAYLCNQQRDPNRKHPQCPRGPFVSLPVITPPSGVVAILTSRTADLFCEPGKFWEWEGPCGALSPQMDTMNSFSSYKHMLCFHSEEVTILILPWIWAHLWLLWPGALDMWVKMPILRMVTQWNLQMTPALLPSDYKSGDSYPWICKQEVSLVSGSSNSSKCRQWDSLEQNY